MIIKELEELFIRDLDMLIENLHEIPEEFLWETPVGVTNSSGVLAQHVIGNLKHFVGKGLGKFDYNRNREREFKNTGVKKDELIKEAEQVKEYIKRVFKHLDQDKMEEPYPLNISYDYSTGKFLCHLYGHLNYHLGQLNYLRRIISQNKG